MSEEEIRVQSAEQMFRRAYQKEPHKHRWVPAGRELYRCECGQEITGIVAEYPDFDPDKFKAAQSNIAPAVEWKPVPMKPWTDAELCPGKTVYPYPAVPPEIADLMWRPEVRINTTGDLLNYRLIEAFRRGQRAK